MASRTELFSIALSAMGEDCGEGLSATGNNLSFAARHAIAAALYSPDKKRRVIKPKPGTPRRYPLPDQKRRSFRA